MNSDKVKIEVPESMTIGGTRYYSGEQDMDPEHAVTLFMLQGDSKQQAHAKVEKLQGSEEADADAETTESEKAESDEEESSDESLPEDFPHASYFEKEGYTSIEEVLALEDRTEVNGISENRDAEVEEYLTNLSDSEG